MKTNVNIKKISKSELIGSANPIPVVIKNHSDQLIQVFGKIIRPGATTPTPFIRRPSEWGAVDFANIEAIRYNPERAESIEVSLKSPNIPKPAFNKVGEPEAEVIPKPKSGPISDQKLFQTGQASTVDMGKIKKDQEAEIERIRASKPEANIGNQELGIRTGDKPGSEVALGTKSGTGNQEAHNAKQESETERIRAGKPLNQEFHIENGESGIRIGNKPGSEVALGTRSGDSPSTGKTTADAKELKKDRAAETRTEKDNMPGTEAALGTKSDSSPSTGGSTGVGKVKGYNKAKNQKAKAGATE